MARPRKIPGAAQAAPAQPVQQQAEPAPQVEAMPEPKLEEQAEQRKSWKLTENGWDWL